MAKIGYPIEVTRHFGTDLDIQVETEAIAWASFKSRFISDMRSVHGTHFYTGASVDENNQPIQLVNEEMFNEIRGNSDWGVKNTKGDRILVRLGFSENNRNELRASHDKSCVSFVAIRWKQSGFAGADKWERIAKELREKYIDVVKVVLTSSIVEYEEDYRINNGDYFNDLKKDDFGLDGMDLRNDITNGITVGEDTYQVEILPPTIPATYTDETKLIAHKIPLDQMFRNTSISLLDSLDVEINSNFTDQEIEIMKLFIFADREELFLEESISFNTINQTDYGVGTEFLYDLYDPLTETTSAESGTKIGNWLEIEQKVTYLKDMNLANMEFLNRKFSEIDDEMDLTIDDEFISTTNQALADLEANLTMPIDEKNRIRDRLNAQLLGLSEEDFRVWEVGYEDDTLPRAETFREILWVYIVEIETLRIAKTELLTGKYNSSGNLVERVLSVRKVRQATKKEWSNLILRNMYVHTQKSNSFKCKIKKFFIALALVISDILNFIVDILYKVPVIRLNLEVLAIAISEIFDTSKGKAKIIVRQTFTMAVVAVISFFTFGAGMLSYVAAATAGGLYAIAMFVISLAIELAVLFTNINSSFEQMRAERIRKKQEKLRLETTGQKEKKTFRKMGVRLKLIDVNEINDLYLMEPGQLPEIEILNKEIQ